ncbi:MAG: hypothetical protein K2X27_07705, partial [Candidatus Obscuribacterales bacterium]|nr:hypothetical protein [Candidatus Obscuribacterales bacterium]
FELAGIKFHCKRDQSKILESSSSRIEADLKGLLRLVKYYDGKTRRFEYDENDELVKISQSDGSSWQKNAAQSWQHFDKAGKLVKLYKAEISLDNLGNYVFWDLESGARNTETPDGLSITELSDGYKTTLHPDGSRLVLCPDGARMQVMPDGTMITENESGTMLRRPDGICLEADHENRLSRIERADKSAREQLRFQNDGQLIEFRDWDSSIWHRIPGERWVHFDQKGMESGGCFKVNISVDESGRFQYWNSEITISESPDRTLITEKRGKDGKTEKYFGSLLDLFHEFFNKETVALERKEANAAAQDLEKNQTANPLQIFFNNRGLITRIEYPAGSWREFEYDNQDRVREFRESDGKRTAINDDDSWTSYDGEEELGTGAAARVEARRDGSLSMEYLESGKITVWRTDASILRFSAENKLEFYMSANGRRFKISESGSSAEYQCTEDEDIDELVKDCHALQSWERTHIDADSDEIDFLKSRIIELNGLDNEPILSTEILTIPI